MGGCADVNPNPKKAQTETRTEALLRHIDVLRYALVHGLANPNPNMNPNPPKQCFGMSYSMPLKRANRITNTEALLRLSATAALLRYRSTDRSTTLT